MVKNKKKPKYSKSKIDGIEKSTLCGFTIIYGIIFAIISGLSKVYLPEIVYIWNIPMDVGTGIWLIAMSVWGMIYLFLQMHYLKNR